MKKTNAMRLLDQVKLPYRAWEYSVSDGALDGLSVAAKTGQNPARVFKTLVLRGAAGGVYVFCLPVACELALKPAAALAKEKSLAMLPVPQLLSVTGYQRGGCSPLAMKKAYPTFLADAALQHPQILVSGGQVGLQIELAPQDLLLLANAKLFSV